MDLNALNSTRNTIAAEPRMDRAIRPVEEEPAPELLPREEKACTLHISDEGYRRWELAQQDAKTQEQESTAGTLPKNGAAAAGAKETVAAATGAEENAEPEPDRMTKLSQFIDDRRYILSHLKPIASKETDDEKNAPDTREAMQGIGRWIMRHASRAEEAMDATIGHIYEKARGNFSFARDLDGLLLGSLERLSHMLAQPDVSEEDKNAAVDAYIMYGQSALSEIKDSMGFGLERLNNLRQLHIGRLSNQNMVYADRAQEGIHALADEAALEELYQDSFPKLEDDHFEELKERIKALQEAEQNPETEQAQKEAQEAQQATEAAEEKERREKEEILPETDF